MRRQNVKGLGEQSRMLLGSCIDSFFGDDFLERSITRDGLERLLEIKQNFAMDVLPELGKMDSNQWKARVYTKVSEFETKLRKKIETNGFNVSDYELFKEQPIING